MLRAKHPTQKPVMVIVDYPIQNEVERDFPWSGASHLSLLTDLAKSGVPQRAIHTTYLSYERPDSESFDWCLDIKKKKNLSEQEALDWLPTSFDSNVYVSPAMNDSLVALLAEIEKVKPSLIVVAGKWSLYFLVGSIPLSVTQGSGKTQKPLGGLSKHRASIETTFLDYGLPENILIPLLPPSIKQRDPSKAPVLMWDYLKVADIYKGLIEEGKSPEFYLNPDVTYLLGIEFFDVVQYLNELLSELDKAKLLVSVDIETKFNSVIDCIGLAYQNNRGMCIPFSSCNNPNYWPAEQEYNIHRLLVKVLSHHNILVVGQNYAYDAQFIWKFWGVKTEAFIDTMILHHVLYNNMQKDLAFLASIYCDKYTYWKDESTH